MAVPWSRRRRQLALATFLAILIGLVAFGTWVWLRIPHEPRFETDSELMEQTTARLREVEAELRSLPLPMGAIDKGTRQVGCGEDSGDVFQPAAVRHWKVSPPDARPVAAAVVEAMLTRNWTGSAAPNQFGSYYLTADHGGWSARAAVGESYERDLVYVEVTINDARPCRLADQ